MKKYKKLIFIYNGKADLFSKVSDFAHKVISPSTYQCDLCKLTYNSFAMKKDWKNFLESLNIELEFLHKEEIPKRFPNENFLVPTILGENTDNKITILLDPKGFNKVKTLEELMEIVKTKIN